jgi:hypothetical protein
MWWYIDTSDYWNSLFVGKYIIVRYLFSLNIGT